MMRQQKCSCGMKFITDRKVSMCPPCLRDSDQLRREAKRKPSPPDPVQVRLNNLACQWFGPVTKGELRWAA